MYANSSFNNNNVMSSPTAWHPIQNTNSYDDLWELPHPTRTFAFDEDENHLQQSQNHQSQQRMPTFFDFENQLPLMTSWSFSSQQHGGHDQQHYPNRQRLGSTSSANTTRTTQSSGEKKQALGDATNTAPVLRISRSRFL